MDPKRSWHIKASAVEQIRNKNEYSQRLQSPPSVCRDKDKQASLEHAGAQVGPLNPRGAHVPGKVRGWSDRKAP